MFSKTVEFFKPKPTDWVSLTQETNGQGHSEKTFVFVWKMDPSVSGGVGHVGIQIGGTKPKKHSEDQGVYVSFHPSRLPSKGLTAVLPLPGDLADNLSDDVILMRKTGEEPKFDDYNGITQESPTNGAPNTIIEINGLDTTAMLNEIKKIKNKVERSEIGYQLLVNVKLSRFLSEAPYFLSQDPSDVLSHFWMKPRPKERVEVHNCCTLVKAILQEGGMDCFNTAYKMPWGITPDCLEEELRASSSQCNWNYS